MLHQRSLSINYRPQRSWGKVIFSVACVKNWAGTPPAGTPPARYTPQAGTPPAGTPPHGQVHPQAGTPPWQVHPPAGTPPWQVHPHSSACWEIRATSGRYASYWNAFLLNNVDTAADM